MTPIAFSRSRRSTRDRGGRPLIRRQVQHAAGDRGNWPAHPQVTPAIGGYRDLARPAEEPSLVDDDRFAVSGEPVGTVIATD